MPPAFTLRRNCCASQKRADGAIFIDLEGDKLGQKVVLRGDGTSVYITQDIGTTILNGGITVFDPARGGTEHLAVPDLVCTNICFGGADLQTAWITASSTGKLYRTRWPRPGLRLNYNA